MISRCSGNVHTYIKRFGFSPEELIVIYKGYVCETVWDSSLIKGQIACIERVQKRIVKLFLPHNRCHN